MHKSDLVQKHGGVRTWKFKQSDFEVWKQYRSAGICGALSAFWIRAHASGGSLVNELGGGDSQYGNTGARKQLNTGLLKEITFYHKIFSAGDGDNQAQGFGTWLSHHGIETLRYSKTKVTSTFRGPVAQSLHGKQHANSGLVPADEADPLIEENIINKGMMLYSDCYARINFSGSFLGRPAGHCVAAWLGLRAGGDVAFFDPNFGEFWFPRRDNFNRFFREYYKTTYRRFPTNFTKDWEVIPCAPRVRMRNGGHITRLKAA
ncbi:YopT-type cysteine protease domain-containing protein [Muricoccus radiodurans]|uniref:YopT-type cysteine protease domain-containing protein n=1 Tax=Muricoccus radiodurans TaxID=2231721 RepID=UPI003CF2F389